MRSHIQLTGVHDGLRRAVTVGANQRVVDQRDVASIMRQAGLSREEFERLVDA